MEIKELSTRGEEKANYISDKKIFNKINKGKSIIVVIILVTFFLSFSVDFFRVGGSFWDEHHMKSDNLIVGKVWADELGIDTKKSNLGRLKGVIGDWTNWSDKEKWFRNDEFYQNGIHRDRDNFSVYDNSVTEQAFVEGNSIEFINGSISKIIKVTKEEYDETTFINVFLEHKIEEDCGLIYEWKIFNDKDEKQEMITYEPYYSQWGGEGWFLSKIFNRLDLRTNIQYDSLFVIRTIVAFFTAIVCTWLCCEVYKKYGGVFGIVWITTLFFSPWIVSFARQTGMIVCTCFLPIIAGLIISRKEKSFYSYLPLVFVAVLIKCLCGYEYISTLMIISVSFLFADFIAEKQKEEKKKKFKQVCLMSSVELGAFVTAFLIHASIRANSIMEGVRETFTKDVLRRTIINNPDAFSEVYRESLESSIFEVIDLYYTWRIPIFKGFEDDGLASNFFLIITLVPIIIFFIDFCRKKLSIKLVVLYILMYLGPISWFVLAKGYSYVHTHFTFLLWYYGYIQICLYIIVKFIIDIIQQRKKEKKTYEINYSDSML